MPSLRGTSAARIQTPRSGIAPGGTPWHRLARSILLLALLGSASSTRAYDVADWLSIGGVVAAGGQCQLVSEDAGDACRGAAPLQTEVSWRPTESDEVFLKLGFAGGDGTNDVSPFALASWAADLQDDVRNINGRYDYLLNAWYAHSFELPEGIGLRVTGGIIDSTDYLDDNAYSNDEYTQFMNQALVNGPHSFLPSYDVGGALELSVGSWSARGVVMNIGENDVGNSFTFWGTQLGYRAETPWGEGNYRLLLVGGSRDFLDPGGTSLERRLAVGLSFDQQLGETFGAWLRLGWQDDASAVTYGSIYSGGINIRGAVWGRPNDEIGVGYGFLPGGNQDLRSTQVAEIYYRVAINEYFALSADVQYMRDEFRIGEGPSGFILGLRLTAGF